MRHHTIAIRIPHIDDKRQRMARFYSHGVILQGKSKAACALFLLASALSMAVGSADAQMTPLSPAVTPNATSLNGPGNVFLTANLVRTGGIGNFGASPSVVVADFNGDGKPDLTVADAGADAVSVLLGKGDGSFQAPIDTTTGMRGQSYVAAGDFSGDGKPDLVAVGTVSAVPTVAVLLGNGDGTFTTKSSFNSFSNPRSVALGDFNGDTKLDMAVVDALNNNDSVVVFLGNGDGTFQAPITTSNLGTVLAHLAATSDFNKDGKLDLVISDQNSNHVVVLLGNGNGTFQAARTFVFPSNPGGWDVAVGDFNGDTIPDIAATSRDAGVANIFLGNGDGNFQAAVSFNASLPNFGPTNLALADFNKDSKLDIITSLGNSSAVGVLFGKGDGTFSAPLFLAANNTPAQVAVADFNGDGNLDWVAGSTSQMFLTVVLGNGNGSFQDAVNYAVGVTPQVALGDLNKDGMLDLVTVNPNSGNLSVLLGKGDGTFQPSMNTAVPGAFFGIAVADFNSDGNLDVVVGSSVGSFPRNVNVLLGKGDGTFAAPVGYSTGGSSAGQIAVADFDGDGKLDIAVVNQSDNTISLLLGNGDGTFQAGTVVTPALATDGFLGTMVAADFNRDGKMDLAIPDFFSLGSGQLAILLGNGDGTFQAPTLLTTGGGATGLAAADLNKDGKLDLAVANQLGTVDIFLGNGDGTFGAPIVLSVVTCPSSAACPGGGFQSHPVVVAAADFDLDGSLDLVVGGFIQAQGSPGNFFSNVNLGFQLFLGNGNGTFTGPQDYLAGVASNTMAAGDFNRDGAPDLAAGDSTENFVTVLLNRTPPPVNVSPKSVAFGDQLVGTSSATQPITVTNNGAAPTTISVAASGDFTQTNTCPVSPATLASGSNCTINVAFKPSTTGLRNGTLTITYNFPGSPQSVALTGTGVAPAVSLSGTSVSFGNQPVGTTSTAQVVGLTNTGTAALTFSSIAITGANSGDFAQTNTCPASPATLAAGANCTINVTFKPTATGNRAASVSITDDAAGSPQSVSLTGTGVAPAVALSPATLTFPGQLVSTTSAAQNVTLTNSGTASLTISSIAVTGANSGDFAQTNTCPASPATLAAGANCTISATFKPVAPGNRVASVTITDDAAGSPQSVSLSGTGTDFKLEAATGANCPTGANCSTSATVTAGGTTSYTLQVAPAGGFNGTVTLSCSGAPSLATCNPSPASVTPNGASASPFTVNVATTAPSMVGPWRKRPNNPPLTGVRLRLLPLLALLVTLLLAGLALDAGRSKRVLAPAALALVLLSVVWISGCGGGGGGTKNPGTPKGTSTLTVTGTSGGVSHTLNLTLTVN